MVLSEGEGSDLRGQFKGDVPDIRSFVKKGTETDVEELDKAGRTGRMEGAMGLM